MRLLGLLLGFGGYAASALAGEPALLLVSAVGWTLLGSRLSWFSVVALVVGLASCVLAYAVVTSGADAAGAVLVALSVALFVVAGRLVRLVSRRT